MAQNLFAAPEQINRFQVEITTGCNLACVGCQRTIGLEAKNWRNAHMKLAAFTKLVGNAPKANVLILQGIGEPTLHPQLPQMIEVARTSGKFGAISFNTNGLFQEIGYYRDLVSRGLNHVSISVDSFHPITAETLRSGTDVEKLKRAVRQLGHLFNGGITLSIVVSRVNLPELSGLLTDLYGLGARIIEMQPLISYSTASDPNCLTQNDVAQVKAILTTTKQRFKDLTLIPAPGLTPNGQRCTRPFSAAYVTVDGLMTPCCTTNDVTLMGRTSLIETSWEAAWNSPAVAQWMRSFFHKDDAICHGCAFNPAHPKVEVLPAQTGIELHMAGQNDAAAAHFAAILKQPDVVESLHRTGVLALQEAKPNDALPYLQAAYDLNPEPRIAHNYAVALLDLKRANDALSILTDILTKQTDYLLAIQSYARALEMVGQAQNATNVLGLLIEKALTKRADAAIRYAIDNISRLDLDPANLIVFANQLRISGRGDWVIPLIDRFIARNPFHLEARMTRACASLKVVYASEEDIASSRHAYREHIAELDVLVQMLPIEKLHVFADAVATAKPFFLAYQGMADTDLQRIYGTAVARIMQARFGEATLNPPRDGRIRVGLASHYWWIHSVSKLFSGWVQYLDRTKFEVFVYQLGPQSDHMSQHVAALADHFQDGERSDEQWRETILTDQLHVLIYPELGMHTTAVRLAAMRLAPVQCVSWGHPVTTGLPHVDYFLSSDLMEPENGAEHYTEQLVRLPHLSIAYQPMPSEGNHFTRAALRVGEHDAVFICCQSLFKYLPRDDAAFVTIAERLPSARFVFLGDTATPPAQVFMARLSAAFAQAGLDPRAHIRMVAPVAYENFPSFLRLGDAYLDSIGWSGGNTTLEALACHLPVVTLPTDLMRGRHSMAILKQIRMEEYIAQDLSSYVDLAVKIIQPAENARARAHIAANIHRLYDDQTPIRALEAFMEEAVRGAADQDAVALKRA